MNPELKAELDKELDLAVAKENVTREEGEAGINIINMLVDFEKRFGSKNTCILLRTGHDHFIKRYKMEKALRALTESVGLDFDEIIKGATSA